MLQWIPDSLFAWLVGMVLLAGVLAYVASKLVAWLPFVGRYKIALELGGIAAMIVGAYFYCDVGYRATVAEFKQKVALAEQQSKEANVALDAKTKEKVQVIKEKQIVIQEKIRDVSVKVDSQCKITTEVIEVLNDAARGVKK